MDMARQLLRDSGAASYCYQLLLRHPLIAGGRDLVAHTYMYWCAKCTHRSKKAVLLCKTVRKQMHLLADGLQAFKL